MYGQLYRGFESHPLRHFPSQSNTMSAKQLLKMRMESGAEGREGSSCEAAREARSEAYSLYVERRASAPTKQMGPYRPSARLAVLDGEVAVPCSPQSAIAGLNPLLRAARVE